MKETKREIYDDQAGSSEASASTDRLKPQNPRPEAYRPNMTGRREFSVLLRAYVTRYGIGGRGSVSRD